MSSTKRIGGQVRLMPENDPNEQSPWRVEQVNAKQKFSRPPGANNPVAEAAVSAVKELAESLQRKIDVKYDEKSELVIIAVYTSDGEELVRQIPPERAIRMAQDIKDGKSSNLDILS